MTNEATRKRNYYTDCDRCDGTGTIMSYQSSCECLTCKGTGLLKIKDRYNEAIEDAKAMLLQLYGQRFQITTDEIQLLDSLKLKQVSR